MWGALIGAGASLLGSAMAGSSAKKAAQTSAASAERTGAMSASAGAFRPVGLTTRFGTSRFTMGTDKYGTPIVTGAEYETSPEIQAIQNRLANIYGTGLTQAEEAAGMFAPYQTQAQRIMNLGAGYISETPEQARQRIFNQLQEARLPSQLQEEARLEAGAFGRGRTGLNIGMTGQPDLYALTRAREAQRAADVVAANQQAQQELAFGTGLLGTAGQLYATPYDLQTKAFSPFQTGFGLTQALETAGQQPLEMGANLGGRNVNTAGANAILQSGLSAANTRLAGSLVGPTAMANTLSKIDYGNLFNKLMGGGGGSTTFGGWSDPYSASAGVDFTAPGVYG